MNKLVIIVIHVTVISVSHYSSALFSLVSPQVHLRAVGFIEGRLPLLGVHPGLHVHVIQMHEVTRRPT
jgi:hypothetical protein